MFDECKNRIKDPKTHELQHGTQSIKLIWRMYDEAEVFVARVFENDMANEKREPYMMAEVVFSPSCSSTTIYTRTE